MKKIKMSIVCVILAIMLLFSGFPIFSIAVSNKSLDAKAQFNARSRCGIATDGENIYYTEQVDSDFAYDEAFDTAYCRLIQENILTGKKNTVLEDYEIYIETVFNGYIYYRSDSDGEIRRLKIGTDNEETIYQGFWHCNFYICNSKIVLICSGQDDFEKVVIMNLDGSAVTEPDLGRIYDFYLINDNLVYQGEGGSSVYELDVKTGKNRLMYSMEGGCNLIGTDDNCLYYTHYGSYGMSIRKHNVNNGKDYTVVADFSDTATAFVIDGIVFVAGSDAALYYYGENNEYTRLLNGGLQYAFIGDYIYTKGVGGEWKVACEFPSTKTVSLGTDENVKYLLFSEIAYMDWSNVNPGEKVPDAIKNKGKYNKSEYKNDSGSVSILSLITEYLDDWAFEKKFENKDTGFYSVAFKSSNDERIIAFRGSQSIFNAEGQKDWTDDIVFGVLNEASLQMTDTLNMIEKYLNENCGDKSKIALTGHSLGGGLAIFASNIYNIKAVTFDSAPTSAVGYYYFPALAAKTFEGADATSYTEHINEHDIIGLWEFNIRNGIKHKNLMNSGINFDAHRRDSIITEKDGSAVLSDIVDENKVNRYTVSVGLHNEGLILATTSHALILPSIASNIVSNILYPKGSLVMGSSGSEALFGNTTGGAGLNSIVPHTDIMYGGNGNDSLYGMMGDDYFIGGNGDDIFKSDGGNDTYFYYKGHGTDTIYDGSGNDKIYLLGFDSSDEITVDSESDKKWIYIKYSGKTIIKIRNYQDCILGNSITHSFEVFSENNTSGIKIMDWGKSTKVKRIKIACPVEVNVISAEGEKILTLPNSKMETVDNDNGYFSVEYDEEIGEYIKYLNIFEDSGCNVEIVGLENGNMNVEIASYTENGNELLFANGIDVNSDSVFSLELGDEVEIRDENNQTVELERKLYKSVQSISCENITLKVGENSKAVFAVNPDDSSCENITFQSGDSEIATIDDDGNITGISEGVVKMTAQIDDKITVFEVTVKENHKLSVGVITAAIILAGVALSSIFVFALMKAKKKKNKYNSK